MKVKPDKVTARQMQVLTFIACYQSRHNLPPKYMDVADFMGTPYVGTAADTIGDLRRKGFLETVKPNQFRSTVLTESGKWAVIFPHAFVQVPKGG